MSVRTSFPRHLRGLARYVLLGASLIAGTSCSRFRPGENDSGPTAQVVFINESLDQADVYAAASGGESVRMGTVMAGRTETLNVPRQFVSRASVNVVARLLARSIVLRTGPIAINDGEKIQVRLPLTANTLSVLPAM